MPETIEAEVLEIDGSPPPEPQVQEPEPAWKSMRGKVLRLDRRWWPLWVLLGLVVFAFVDPEAMHDLHGLPLVGAGASGAMSSLTVQSLAFLFFWVTVTSAILTSRWLDSPGHPSQHDTDSRLAGRVADQS